VTATWVVTSADVPDHNGINLTLQENGAHWKQAAGDPYLRFRFDDQNTFNIYAEVDGGSQTSLYSDTYTVGDVTDGFTFTATITATGWSFTSTGLPSLDDASGNWTATHDLDTLFDNSTHIGGFIQQSNSTVDISFDSKEVVGVAEQSIIPEPSTLLIWSLGLLGLAWFARRRRR